MTLNLMLTSSDAVYLSGDFRLFSFGAQAPLPDSYDTQKLIPVIRHEWSALIAYMGVASAPPLIDDMGHWVAGQIDAIPPASDFGMLPACLRQLNRWIGRFRGDRRIALSVAGFRNRRPFMMLLSNFMDLDGQVTEAGPELREYLRTPSQPEVRAVGTRRPDVFERVRLLRMLQANASRGPVPHLIRQMIADVNAGVARRSGGTISEACVSGCLLRTGAAAIGPHGIPAGAACFPGWLRSDLARRGIIGFAPPEHADRPLPWQWNATTARVVNTTMVRTHEIANAGTPLLDGVDRPAGAATWTLARAAGQTTVSITFSDT